MHRPAGLVGALLLAFCTVASAQSAGTLQNRYSHIQDLNNAGSAIVYANSPSSAQLHQAIEKLKQAQSAIAQLQSKLAVGSSYAAHIADRRNDNLHYQADAYARIGDTSAALDALNGLTTHGIWAGWKRVLAGDKYLNGLHDDPRFKALLARFDAVASRWNAAAFTSPTNKLSEAQRIAGLSLFWSEARYNFAYFDHVPKLDWNQTYLEFAPKVVAAKSLHDYYDVLMRLAPLLHDSHTGIYPPKSLWNQFFAKPSIATELIQNRVIITSVGSKAAAQGLHVGDEIVSVDGHEVHQYAEQHVALYFSSSTPQDRAVRVYRYHLLAGDYRKPVKLGIKNAAGAVHMITLAREKIDSAAKPSVFRFRVLGKGIDYLSLDEFDDDRGAKAFQKHLPEILKAKGLILDLRNNGGGSSSNRYDVLTWLTGRPIPEEAASSREYVPAYRAWSGPSEEWKFLGSGNYPNPRHQHYDGPVVVLIGPRTISAAEDFVVSFEAMNRGILVGRKTAGSTGQPLGFELPGRGFARICTLRDTFPDGREFVGIGIAPQIEVEPTVADIRAGRDPAMDAATKALLSNKAAATRR